MLEPLLERRHPPYDGVAGKETCMSLDLRKSVALVGVGCTQFGELYEHSAEDLLCDAVDEALVDAGCERDRIEAAWVGSVASTFGGDALADARSR
jgi:acetyl-CoA acetyltransferase